MPPRSLSHLLGKKSPADCAAGRKCAGSTYQSSQCIIILKTLTTAKTFFNLILYHHTLLFFIYLPTYHLNRPARSSRHWSTSLTSSWLPRLPLLHQPPRPRQHRARLGATCTMYDTASNDTRAVATDADKSDAPALKPDGRIE